MPKYDEKFKRIEAEAFFKLLEIKDSDIRISTVRQGKTAIDKGLHIGGAFSGIIPLVSLYYGDHSPLRRRETRRAKARTSSS